MKVSLNGRLLDHMGRIGIGRIFPDKCKNRKDRNDYDHQLTHGPSHDKNGPHTIPFNASASINPQARLISGA